MSSIRGVSVGGNLYDVTDTTNIAPKEPTGYASREYQVGRTFIMADGLLYKATAHINVGDAIVVNGNAERTNVDELFEATENVEAIPTMLNGLGAKNLFYHDYTTRTALGYTVTVKDDGSLRFVGSVPSGSTQSVFVITTNMSLKKGRYILSGMPSEGNNSFLRIYRSDHTGLSPSIVYNYGVNGEVEFEVTEDITEIRADITLLASDNLSDITVSPMIRPASIADDTYVPYAKTNRELTEELTDDTGWVEVNNNLKYRKIGHVVSVMANTIYPTTSWTTIGVLPENARPSYPFYQNSYTNIDAQKACNFYINAIGQVQCQANAAISANITYLV